jgi:hypothetical protein
MGVGNTCRIGKRMKRTAVPRSLSSGQIFRIPGTLYGSVRQEKCIAL